MSAPGASIPSIVMVAHLSRKAIYAPRDSGPAKGLKIRTLTPDDLPALAPLFTRSYAGTVHDLRQTPAEALKYLEEHSSGGRLAPMLWDCSFLALDGETPVAAVFTSNENSHPLFHEVFTHPDSRGHGLATALLRRAMSALTAQGFGHVRLRVAVANETARQLYERLGFVPA